MKLLKRICSMKILISAIFLHGCFPSGIDKHERLSWYFEGDLREVQIVRFHESPSPAMDHTYCWLIEIDESDSLELLMSQVENKPSNIDGLGPDTGIVMGGAPDWWHEDKLEKMRGYRFILTTGAGVIAIVDEQNSQLYLQVND